jgi:hypothetical protein
MGFDEAYLSVTGRVQETINARHNTQGTRTLLLPEIAMIFFLSFVL